MKTVFSRRFKKQYKKLSVKIRAKFDLRLQLFLAESWNHELNLHKLSGVYEGLWSINITGDIRAIFDRDLKDAIIFVAIGTHPELYG